MPRFEGVASAKKNEKGFGGDGCSYQIPSWFPMVIFFMS